MFPSLLSIHDHSHFFYRIWSYAPIQVFDDEKNGKGHLIIGWRVDGKVDVYHQPSLNLYHAKYDIAGKGLANMIKVEMQFAEFEVDDFGVQAHYQFKDLKNRAVEIRINEYNTKKRKPFGLLAPMGNAAEHPSAMPLVLMHDFYFVRRKNTDFHVKIDGKDHQPDALPVPMDWTRMYFTRYSPEPVIATFNPAFDGVLPEIEIGKEQVNEGDFRYGIEWGNQVPKLKSTTKNNKTHPIKLSFNPAFPHLDHLEIGSPVKGTFEIAGHPATGAIGGDYLVCPNKEGAILVLVPSKVWNDTQSDHPVRCSHCVFFRFFSQKDYPPNGTQVDSPNMNCSPTTVSVLASRCRNSVSLSKSWPGQFPVSREQDIYLVPPLVWACMRRLLAWFA